MPKATKNVDPTKVKSEVKEEKEMGVEVNQAYEGGVQVIMDTRSV